MSKDLANGLVETEVATQSRKRKNMSAEDVKAVLEGVKLLSELGASEKVVFVLEKLAAKWHGEDKEALAAAKNEVIEHFGGSDSFKDFIEGEFKDAMLPYQGLVKIIPICNNIRSFYARRQSTSRKPKMIQVSIEGNFYNVNAEYFDSLQGKSIEEKRELILSHKDTTAANNVYEVL